MYRQQVLKCRLGDRLVTGSDRFEEKTVTQKSQCLCGFQQGGDRGDSFFQVLKIFRKNQNNKQNSKNLTPLTPISENPVFMRVLGVTDK